VFRKTKTGPRELLSKQPFIKNRADLQKFLSYVKFAPYSTELVESFAQEFFRAQRALGKRGIIVINVYNALSEVLRLSSYDFAYPLVYTEKKVSHLLLARVHEVICENLRRILKRGINDCIFRIAGSENATPPYLPPSLFREYVVYYDYSLINIIQEHKAIAELHCHGKIGQVLESIASMHPDALDPIEPFPFGDITLERVKKKIGSKVCLIGNVPATGLLHYYNEQETEKCVRNAIKAGTPGGGFILSPTSFLSIGRFNATQENNIIQFIQSGLKYGQCYQFSSKPVRSDNDKISLQNLPKSPTPRE